MRRRFVVLPLTGLQASTPYRRSKLHQERELDTFRL
jgi:hypothetical protein